MGGMKKPATIRRTLPYTLRLRLIATRREAGMSQAELADRLGIDRSTVVRWESGDIAPKRSSVMAWALATDYDAEWLWSGVDPEGPESRRYAASIQQYAKHLRLAEVPSPRILIAA